MSRENSALEVDEEEFVDELKPDTKLMLGQYTIEDFLAAGGFGITYLAKDSLGRRVVIKECFPGSFCRRQNFSVTPRSRAHQNELKSIVRLFSQEAMSLAKANHPNIVGVHQVFEENNTAYMALDYVHGRDLLEILQDDPDSLKPELVEGYLVKILDAIKHIHQLGMLHRDISPDNIIIDEKGEPILIDFGAARESTNERVTRMLSALRVVKDGYSPQEFYIAGSDQTPSCDLYSLAASFYHIITQEVPPDSQWRLSACAAGDNDPYVSLGEKTDGYSQRFVKALDKAMAVLPRDRMQSAEEWLAYLQGESPIETPDSQTPSVAETSDIGAGKKFPVLPVLLGTTAVAAALGAGVFLVSPGNETGPTTPVEQSAAVTVTESQTAAQSEDVAAVPSDESGAASTPDTANAVENPALVEAEPASPPVLETPPTAPATPALEVEPEVAVIIAEPPVPAVEETTDFVVPPIISALPETTNVPQPRPLREVDVATAATQPFVDATAPEAPVPDVVADNTEAVTPVADIATNTTEVEASEPNAIASQDITPIEDSAASLDFFMSMSTAEPDIISATPAAPTASSTSAQVVGEQQQVAATDTDAQAELNADIITRFVPVLPFTLSPWTPGLVVSASDTAPSWLAPNSRIVSVEGVALTSNDDIRAAIEAAAPNESAGSYDVVIGIDAGLNTSAVEQTLTVSKEQHTLLLNGLQFVTREQGSGWVTQVVDAPATSNFRAGDTVVSYVSTWEDLDGPNSLQSILERELANGTSSFSFAVSRDGEIWIEAFNLASISN
ncbi:MAG: protein kinase, partial [Pseudomonadota bacterium]